MSDAPWAAAVVVAPMRKLWGVMPFVLRPAARIEVVRICPTCLAVTTDASLLVGMVGALCVIGWLVVLFPRRRCLSPLSCRRLSCLVSGVTPPPFFGGTFP